MSDKFEFIDAEYAVSAANTETALSVVKMCALLEVSRSGFYEWRAGRRPPPEDVKNLIIVKLFTDSDGTYGYRRVHADLAAGRAVRARAGPLPHA